MKFVAFRLKLVSEHSENHKVISHLHSFWELSQKSFCSPASEQIHWNTWMLHSTYWKSATDQRDQRKQKLSSNMSLEACSMLQHKHGWIKLTGFVLTCILHCHFCHFLLHWHLPVWNSLCSQRKSLAPSYVQKLLHTAVCDWTVISQVAIRKWMKWKESLYRQWPLSQRQRHCPISLEREVQHNWRQLLRNRWPKPSQEIQPLMYSSLGHFRSIPQHLLSIYLTYPGTNLQLLGSLWPHIATSELLRQICIYSADPESLQLTSVYYQTSVTYNIALPSLQL